MSEYLSKEEIKQWRSSLEKITLEEFAARLGKKVEEKKETNDLIDKVLHGKPVVSSEVDRSSMKVERLSAIADRAYEREKEIYTTAFSAKNLKGDVASEINNVEQSITKNITKKVGKSESQKKLVEKTQKAQEKIANINTGDELRDEVRFVFKKNLTAREQRVFNYFLEHKNKIVYAKDLASLLELPKDYIYKYIKTLRAKLDGDVLQNADKGGFILTVTK